jgi:hypothetical protein
MRIERRASVLWHVTDPQGELIVIPSPQSTNVDAQHRQCAPGDLSSAAHTFRGVPRNHSSEGTFSATRIADNGQSLSGGDIEIEACYCLDSARAVATAVSHTEVAS